MHFQNKPLVWHNEDPEDPDKGLNGLEKRVGHIQHSLETGRGKNLGLFKHDLLVRGGGVAWYDRIFWWVLGRATSHLTYILQYLTLCRIATFVPLEVGRWRVEAAVVTKQR